MNIKVCELCDSEISVYSRYCPQHAAEIRREKDRNRKRQERQNGARYAGVKTSQDRQRDVKRDWVCNYLMSHSCVDCGENDILVLEFDHRGDLPKTKDVSVMINSTYSLKTLMSEVDKCDVRCANCHKRKTIERYGETYRTRFITLRIGSTS